MRSASEVYRESVRDHPHNEHIILERFKRTSSSQMVVPRCQVDCQLAQLLPIVEWLPQMLASDLMRKFVTDLTAGLTVAAVVVPQGMAYGMLAGLPPVYGLYTALLPSLAYLVFGTSRHLSVGPFALVAVLTAQGVMKVVPNPSQDPGAAVAAAATISFLSGCVLLVMGVLRLGFIATFLSDSVLSGYTTAVGLIIPLSQLGHALDVQTSKSAYGFFGDVWGLGKGALDQGVNPYSLAFLGISIVVLLALQCLNKSRRFSALQRMPLPAELIVVVVSTGLCFAFDFPSNPDLKLQVLGKIPAGLPKLGVPDLFRFDLYELLSPVFTIALMIYINSMSASKTFGRQFKYEVDNNQELVALGFSNLCGSIGTSFPASASLSRTAVAASVGVASPAHALWTAVILLLVLLYLSPLLVTLPLAVLAAIVVVAFKSLLLNGYSEARLSWKVSRTDFLMWNISFWSTLGTNVTVGIAIAVAADIFYLVWCTTQPTYKVLGRLAGTERMYRNRRHFAEALPVNGLLIFRFDAPLHFANREVFLERLRRELRAADAEFPAVADVSMSSQNDACELGAGRTDITVHVKTVVVDLSPMSHIDLSAVRALERLRDELADRKTRLVLAHCQFRCYQKLSAMGFFQEGPSDVWCFRELHDAVSFGEGRLLPTGLFESTDTTGDSGLSENSSNDGGVGSQSAVPSKHVSFAV
jgi:high affinity sulfate transporter 1